MTDGIEYYVNGGRLIWRGMIEANGEKRLIELDLSKTDWKAIDTTTMVKVISHLMKEALLHQDGKPDINVYYPKGIEIL